MELICYETLPGNVVLRPAPKRRTWMDETPHAFAYHCLPLVIANLHGWEMLTPFAFEVTWGGGPAPGDLGIVLDPADAGPTRRDDVVKTHFGSGILTIAPAVIMRTAPGYNLWITGPVNSFKDGIQPLSASIESDWMPFTFSMNWKITRPHSTIRFEKDEPFCTFFPVQRGVVASCEPRIMPVESNPDLAESYRWAGARRELDEMLADREREMYQSWYTAGEMPNRATGHAPDDHETHIVARPFKREG
jgi:Family of unknown function (DUF6065)